MTRGSRFGLYKVVLTTLLLGLLQFPASAAQPQGPEQALNVVHIGFETASVNVTVTGSTGASAEFPGYVASDSPFLTLDAEITVVSSTWPAFADPSIIHIKGRANEELHRHHERHGRRRQRHRRVGPHHRSRPSRRAPDGPITARPNTDLTATVTNSDEQEGTGPGGKDWSGTYIPITINTTKPAKKDPFLAYTPYIAGIAVIGIIAGAAIKIKARRERHKKPRPDANKSA